MKPGEGRSRLLHIFLLIALAVLSLLTFYAGNFVSLPEETPVPSPRPSFNPKVLTVGTDSRITCILFKAVNHFIPGNRFRLEPIMLEDPGERWERMSAGVLDLSFATMPEFVLSCSRHRPGKMIAPIASSDGADGIVYRGNISEINQILGKKIILVPGSPGHYFLIRCLDGMARSTSEVNLVFVPAQTDVYRDFMQTDLINCSMLSEPCLSRAVDNGAQLMLSTKDRSLIEEIICASNFALQNRREDIQTVLNAYFNLIRLIRTNPGLARGLILKKSSCSMEEVDLLLSSVRLRELSEARLMAGQNAISEMQKIQQIWAIEGLPNAGDKIDFPSVIDTDFLKNAEVSDEIFNDSITFTPAPSETIEYPSTPYPIESPSSEEHQNS